MRTYLRENNEDLYILSILMLSFVLMVALIAPLVPHNDFWPVMGALLLALLPATQGAVDLVNNAVLALLEAECAAETGLQERHPGGGDDAGGGADAAAERSAGAGHV